MTDYVATRWYRAPELLLSCKTYTKAIDMWSVGCILAELIGRKPFFVGSDTQSQLEIIMNTIGTPSQEEMNLICRAKSRDFIRALGKRLPKNFEEIFPYANPEAADLVEKLLKFDPEKRLTAEEAIKHQYFEGLHFPEDEPTRLPLSKFDF